MQATEQHYTVQQVAAMWGISDLTIRRLFEDDPAVLKISQPRLLKNVRKNKPHVLLRIPASAIERVHSQWTAGPRLEVQRRGRAVK